MKGCRWLVAIAAAMVAGGCAAEPTQIVLVIDSDLARPDPLERIELEIASSASAPTRVMVDTTDPLTPPFPLTLTLFPRGSAGTDVRVTVRARDPAGATLLTREIRTSFLPGSSRMLRVLLAERCLGVRCGGERTCDETGCRAVAIAADELPAWPGSPPVLEGPACEPREERCDGFDDDCDELVDEGFDLRTDAQHCGACGNACDAASCAAGFCSGEAIAEVAAGGAHTCARREDGRVTCWGWNLEGQLGASEPEVRSVPADLEGIDTAVQLAAGTAFACARLVDGRVVCWGDGSHGELGDGTTSDRATPAPVMGGASFSWIAAGAQHACGVTMGGEVLCWGLNDRGQLGDGTMVARSAPVPVMGIAGAQSVSCGARHTCALLMDGSVRCWGANGAGQLGDGTTMPSPVPVTPPVVAASAVGAGRRHTCALLADGRVACWGANESAQLGDGTTTPSPAPVAVAGLSDARAIAVAAAGTHACVVRSGGAITCWGSNLAGQLGDATTDTRTMPVEAMLGAAIAIGAGAMHDDGTGHTCAVVEGGAVVCWGAGSLGRLGDGGRSDRATPGAVVGLPFP